MGSLRPVELRSTSKLTIDVVGQSPHAFGYKVWKKEPTDADWQDVTEGQTADDIPDAIDLGPFPTATRLAYWIGVGGHAISYYRVVVSLSQDGHVLRGGMHVVEGRTSTSGAAAQEAEAVLV